MRGHPRDVRTARQLLDTTAVPGDEPWCELADRVEKVLALHRKATMGDSDPGWCAECLAPWPCSTVRALDGEGR